MSLELTVNKSFRSFLIDRVNDQADEIADELPIGDRVPTAQAYMPNGKFKQDNLPTVLVQNPKKTSDVNYTRYRNKCTYEVDVLFVEKFNPKSESSMDDSIEIARQIRENCKLSWNTHMTAAMNAVGYMEGEMHYEDDDDPITFGNNLVAVSTKIDIITFEESR